MAKFDVKVTRMFEDAVPQASSSEADRSVGVFTLGFIAAVVLIVVASAYEKSQQTPPASPPATHSPANPPANPR